MFPVVLNSRSLVVDDGDMHKTFWKTLPTPNPGVIVFIDASKLLCTTPFSITGYKLTTLKFNRKAKQKKLNSDVVAI